MFQSIYHHETLRSYLRWRRWCPCRGWGQRSNVKVTNVLPQFWRFWSVTPFCIHRWLQMMHKLWDSGEEIPCCFSVKFQGHTGPVLILGWLQNDAPNWSSIEEVLYCSAGSSVKCQGHMGRQIADFSAIWAFLGDNSTLNSRKAIKWHI